RNDNTGISVNSITTHGGRVSLSTTTGGVVTVQSGGIASNGGDIDIAVAAGSGFTNLAGIASGGGNAVILADVMSLTGGTLNAGAGIVVLGPRTIGNNIALGTRGYLTQPDFDTITTGMLQIGYRNPDAT